MSSRVTEDASLAFGAVATTGTLAGVAAFGDRSGAAWGVLAISVALGFIAARLAAVRAHRARRRQIERGLIPHSALRRIIDQGGRA